MAESLLGFLPPESVEFTDEHVGRGGSGIVTRGWLTPSGRVGASDTAARSQTRGSSSNHDRRPSQTKWASRARR